MKQRAGSLKKIKQNTQGLTIRKEEKAQSKGDNKFRRHRNGQISRHKQLTKTEP